MSLPVTFARSLSLYFAFIPILLSLKEANFSFSVILYSSPPSLVSLFASGDRSLLLNHSCTSQLLILFEGNRYCCQSYFPLSCSSLSMKKTHLSSLSLIYTSTCTSIYFLTSILPFFLLVGLTDSCYNEP